MPSICDDDDAMDDIEDLVGEGDLTGLERSHTRANAVVKRVKKVRSDNKNADRKKHVDSSLTGMNGAGAASSTVPGTQKIWVKTWGCAHNNSDSEYMAGQLAAYGYTITGKSNNNQQQFITINFFASSRYEKRSRFMAPQFVHCQNSC